MPRRRKLRLRPFHNLVQLRAKFGCVRIAAITTSAAQDAFRSGLSLAEILNIIQQLRPRHFKTSAPGHTPPTPGCWHDTYKINVGGEDFYLKFAGTCPEDVRLTSFRKQ
jgi:hypothetical protein